MDIMVDQLEMSRDQVSVDFSDLGSLLDCDIDLGSVEEYLEGGGAGSADGVDACDEEQACDDERALSPRICRKPTYLTTVLYTQEAFSSQYILQYGMRLEALVFSGELRADDIYADLCKAGMRVQEIVHFTHLGAKFIGVYFSEEVKVRDLQSYMEGQAQFRCMSAYDYLRLSV
jgi:hypothetical protein